MRKRRLFMKWLNKLIRKFTRKENEELVCNFEYSKPPVKDGVDPDSDKEKGIFHLTNIKNGHKMVHNRDEVILYEAEGNELWRTLRSSFNLMVACLLGKAQMTWVAAEDDSTVKCLVVIMIHKAFHMQYLNDKIKVLQEFGLNAPPAKLVHVLDPRTQVMYTRYVYQ